MNKEKIIGVYIIRCSSNNKVYIGSSKTMMRRWYEHRTLLNRGIHHNCHLQSAFNKYGKESFSYTLIEKCEDSSLLERETYWVDQYQSHKTEYGFNLVLPGSYPLKGSDENISKVASRQKDIVAVNISTGEMLEFDSLKNCSDTLCLRYPKIVDVAQMWSGNKNSKHRSYKGWIIYYKEDYPINPPTYERNSSRRRPILCVHRATNEVKEFVRSRDLFKEIGGDVSKIYACLKGTLEEYKGYSFRYKN